MKGDGGWIDSTGRFLFLSILSLTKRKFWRYPKIGRRFIFVQSLGIVQAHTSIQKNIMIIFLVAGKISTYATYNKILYIQFIKISCGSTKNTTRKYSTLKYDICT